MKRFTGETSDQAKKRRDVREARPEEGKGKEPASLEDVIQARFREASAGPSSTGEVPGSSTEKAQDISNDEEHAKMVRYAQENLGLDVSPQNTGDEVLGAVNEERRKMQMGDIDGKELTRRADVFDRLYEGEFSDSKIESIRNMRPHEMSYEDRGIYAANYGIDLDRVEDHWNYMHENRVNYAKRYTNSVRFEHSPLEVLEKIHQLGGRVSKIKDLDALDAKAGKLADLGEEGYRSSDDERVRERIMPLANARRTDQLLEKNSETWRKAQEYYEEDRGGM